ncbi:MAG: hypothetical protein H7222_15250 [Methylotenera sp.]|nr:hypothetical protein [Oligoflexia bacterium]
MKFSHNAQSRTILTSRFMPLLMTSALLLQFALAGCAGPTLGRNPASGATSGSTAASYEKMLDLTNQVMTRKLARDFLNDAFKEELTVNAAEATKYGFSGAAVKSLTETQFMMLLQENPDHWGDIEKYLASIPAKPTPQQIKDLAAQRTAYRKQFKAMINSSSVLENFKKKNNVFDPFVMETADGSPGYSNLQIFVDHPSIDRNGVTHDPENLRQVWVDFINSAKNELILNVFDFDLMVLADALIDRANTRAQDKKSNITVQVGIDKNVIATRPEVQAVFNKLLNGGVKVTAVDSVGLNHQKLIAIDWSVAGKGRVLMSSGNATQSCIGPEGDQVLATAPARSPYSIPNANHVMTMDSPMISLVIHHELTKTLDAKYLLRGNEYPLSGTYKVYGEASPVHTGRRSVVLAFTPNGGLDNINANFIGRAIRTTTGPIRMAQFAFSSKDVEAALLDRAKADVSKPGGIFDFQSVGDTPFAMQDWSIFLDMTGMQLDRKRKPDPYFFKTSDPFLAVLGAKRDTAFRESIRIAPAQYGTHGSVDQNGAKAELTSKIHHKVIILGDYTITGSFNFSEGAESNQEYITLWDDERVNTRAKSFFDWLYKNSASSVSAEALKRNKTRKFDKPEPKNVETTGKSGD